MTFIISCPVKSKGSAPSRKEQAKPLNHHPKEAKSIIAEPPGEIKEVFIK